MVRLSCGVATAARLACAFLLLSTSMASAIVEDFSGPADGTVVAGTLPQGGSASGLLFPGFQVSVVNTGGGPNTCAVFDSSIPGLGCEDLGTPNVDFAGPGIGTGGGLGQPGENNTFLGNLLIVQENLLDANADNVLDEPDDEAGGGRIRFDFTQMVMIPSVTIVDIDANEVASIEGFVGANSVGTVNLLPLGNNSVQTISLASLGTVTAIQLTMSNSGAIAEIEFDVSVPIENSTWGAIKSLYRD